MPALDFPWVLIAKDTSSVLDTHRHTAVPSARLENLTHSQSEDRLREALETIAKRQSTSHAKMRLLAILGEAQNGPVNVNRASKWGSDEPAYHLLTAMKKVAIHKRGILVLDNSKLSPAFCLVNVACVNGQTTLIQQPLPREAYSPSFDPARYHNGAGEVLYDADAVFDSSDLDEPLTVQGSIVPLAQVFRPEVTEDSAVEVDRRLSDSTVPFSSSIDRNFGSDGTSSRRTSKTSCCSSQCDSTASFAMNNFGPSRLLMRERSVSLGKKKPPIAPAIAPRVAFFDGNAISTDTSFTTESV